MNESSPRAEYHYSIYGVRVTSDCPFHFTTAGGADEALAHVRITHRAIFPSSESASDAWFACRQLADGSTYLRWRDLYEFNVAADGSQIACRQLREGDVGVLQNFLFGQALSFALVRQRFEPLHAAVVAIGEVAIGFLGDCTYGKSTLAASFVEAGHRLVTDDLQDCVQRCVGPEGGPARQALVEDRPQRVHVNRRPDARHAGWSPGRDAGVGPRQARTRQRARVSGRRCPRRAAESAQHQTIVSAARVRGAAAGAADGVFVRAAVAAGA